MNIKLTILKLLFGGVNDLLSLLGHVQEALRAESIKLHAEADELERAANIARASAVAASNIANKIGS